MGQRAASSSSEPPWRTDLVVIGAGPAGSAAAIEASRRGLSVVVVDKARFPRDKCCGDGLTANALRHLDDLGLDPGTIGSWVDVGVVRLRAPSGRTVRLDLPGRPGRFSVVCRRRELDAALVDLARRQGVTVLEEHPLSAVDPRGDAVAVTAGDVELLASHVIAADGMWSPTRRLLGLAVEGYRGDWHAFRQYFTGVSDRAATELVVWFEPDLLPGYGWSFPIGGGVANVGFGILRGRGHSIQDMKDLWPDLLARPHVRDWLGDGATPESPHRAWPIPARLGSTEVASGRVLFVGDAATAPDPMTGEGIGQALETGRGAASAIASGGTPAAIAERYRSGLTAGMVRDHRFASALSLVLTRRHPTDAALRAVDINDWTRRNFGRWLFEDYPRAALLNPRRWRRGLLGSGGARFTPSPDEAVVPEAAATP